MQIKAQRFTIATHAAIIMSLESVFATLLAVIILKENINMQMVIGFIFIFFSVLTSELGDTVLKYIKVHNKLETNIEIISAGETKQ
jgi:drug/metabolite transporter (DMT)-like permease